MSLKTKVKSATKAAFAQMDSVKSNIVLTQTGNRVYDPATQQSTEEVLDTIKFTGILTHFKETDGVSILLTDRKLLVEKVVLQERPTIRDRIKVDDEDWLIKDVKMDTAKAVYILHLSRP